MRQRLLCCLPPLPPSRSGIKVYWANVNQRKFCRRTTKKRKKWQFNCAAAESKSFAIADAHKLNARQLSASLLNYPQKSQSRGTKKVARTFLIPSECWTDTNRVAHTYKQSQMEEKETGKKIERKRRVLSSLLDNLTLLWPAFLIPTLLLCFDELEAVIKPRHTRQAPFGLHSWRNSNYRQAKRLQKGWARCQKGKSSSATWATFTKSRRVARSSRKNQTTNAFQRKNFNQKRRTYGTYEWKAKLSNWK